MTSYPEQYQKQSQTCLEGPADIPIVHALYGCYKSWHGLLLKFPKVERYTLGQTCSTYLLDIIEHVLHAASSSEISQKKKAVQTASTKLDTLKILVRLCKDCHCVSEQQYQQCSAQLYQIGKMTGGWLKSFDTQKTPR